MTATTERTTGHLSNQESNWEGPEIHVTNTYQKPYLKVLMANAGTKVKPFNQTSEMTVGGLQYLSS